MTKLSMTAMTLLILVGVNTASYAQESYDFVACIEPDLTTTTCTGTCVSNGYSPKKRHAVAVDLDRCPAEQMSCLCEI